MPQIAEIVAGVLEGTIVAVDDSQRRTLRAELDAIERLLALPDGERLDEARKILDEGFLPDFYASAAIDLTASLAMSTARERDVTVGGSVTFGPLAVTGSLSNRFRQGTETNVVVDLHMEREGKNQAREYIHSLFPVITARQ